MYTTHRLRISYQIIICISMLVNRQLTQAKQLAISVWPACLWSSHSSSLNSSSRFLNFSRSSIYLYFKTTLILSARLFSHYPDLIKFVVFVCYMNENKISNSNGRMVNTSCKAVCIFSERVIALNFLLIQFYFYPHSIWISLMLPVLIIKHN